jgi:hypothetical protein
MSFESAKSDWITVCGQGAPELEASVSAKIKERLAHGEFTEQDMRIVADLGKRKDALRLNLSDAKLERIRRLCQLWDIELRPPHQITSHRRIVGPLIVGLKKLVYPILRVLLKDLIRQQRDFNGSVIAYLAETEVKQSDVSDSKSR